MASSYSLEVGDSFEIRDANGKHLHLIIAEASKEIHSSIILVYLSSAKTIYKEDTTIIKPGEHPYVTKMDDESWVRYRNTLLCSRDQIATLITKHFGKISDGLLKRIQTDFENSHNVNKGIKKIYIEWKTDKLFDSLK